MQPHAGANLHVKCFLTMSHTKSRFWIFDSARFHQTSKLGKMRQFDGQKCTHTRKLNCFAFYIYSFFNIISFYLTCCSFEEEGHIPEIVASFT